MADGGRRRRATGGAVLGAVLGLALAHGFPVGAQEPDALTETNDVIAAEILARISEMVQSGEPDQPEEPTPPQELVPANDPAHSGGRAEAAAHPNNSSGSEGVNRSSSSRRSQNEDRRSRGRRSSQSKPDPVNSPGSANDSSRSGDRPQNNAPAETNGSLAKLDYSAFRIIADRNIFDPNRYPRRSGEPSVRPTPKPAEFVTLVGTMSYERGSFAFFDGTSSEYKRALKLTDVIAGYKVTNIAPNGVQLAAGTNELELRVGMQLRREEAGPWRLADQSRSYAATPASAATNTAAAASAAAATTTTDSEAAAGGSESDIIKKLMQRREQE